MHIHRERTARKSRRLTNVSARLSGSEVACFPRPRPMRVLLRLLTETFVIGCWGPCSLPPPKNSLLTHPLHYDSVKHEENDRKTLPRVAVEAIPLCCASKRKRITAVHVGRFGSQTRNISNRQSSLSERSATHMKKLFLSASFQPFLFLMSFCLRRPSLYYFIFMTTRSAKRLYFLFPQ